MYWGVKIYFKNYNNFEEAKLKWVERVQRIDWNNIYIMFTNWDGDIQLALRFDALPFKNKVIFVDEEMAQDIAITYIKLAEKWELTENMIHKDLYTFDEILL